MNFAGLSAGVILGVAIYIVCYIIQRKVTDGTMGDISIAQSMKDVERLIYIICFSSLSVVSYCIVMLIVYILEKMIGDWADLVYAFLLIIAWICDTVICNRLPFTSTISASQEKKKACYWCNLSSLFVVTIYFLLLVCKGEAEYLIFMVTPITLYIGSCIGNETIYEQDSVRNILRELLKGMVGVKNWLRSSNEVERNWRRPCFIGIFITVVGIGLLLWCGGFLPSALYGFLIGLFIVVPSIHAIITLKRGKEQPTRITTAGNPYNGDCNADSSRDKGEVRKISPFLPVAAVIAFSVIICAIVRGKRKRHRK